MALLIVIVVGYVVAFVRERKNNDQEEWIRNKLVYTSFSPEVKKKFMH